MIFLLLLFLLINFFSKNFAQDVDYQFHPDTFLNITELINKYGYPSETHEIETEDGYILTVFRIPHGRNGSGVNKRPILLVHGLMGRAENYIVAGMFNTSLAYHLADNGYDVWLGNARGTSHCWKHKVLDPKKPKFWDFSFHEIGYYDLPAMIDYMIDKNGSKKVFYIGHSQGGTVFYICVSLRPEYQSKIALASLLAPGGYMKHFNNTILLTLSKGQKRLTAIAKRAKFYTFPPPSINLTSLYFSLCIGSTAFKGMCDQIVHAFFSTDTEKMDMAIIPLCVRFVSTASIKQLLHFAQTIDARRFRLYDYGKKENMKLYGSEEPPDYPVQNINTPVAMYYSKGDDLAFWEDIEDICDAIPGCKRKYLIPDEQWTHYHFAISKYAKEVLFDPLFEYMSKFDVS